MPQLHWYLLNFKNESEYYETLGFLCKDEEVIRIYIENNHYSGARGPQGRLRILRGNCEFFPRPLKELFINKKKDKRKILNCNKQ